MSDDSVLTVLYCDDVRREEGNKLSFMGVYSGDLFVPAFPTLLLKLCVVLTFRIPVESPVSRVVFRVSMDEQLIAESTVDGITVRIVQSDAQDPPKWTSVVNIVQLAPFPIASPGKLRVSALVNEIEIRGNALRISSPPLVEENI